MATNTEARKIAEQFYGGMICVVTGKSDGVDWHHINENSQDERFPNVVPLAADLNRSVIENNRKDRLHLRSLGELETNALDSKIQQHFETGNHAHGYGCARIGSHLEWKHQNRVDSALRFSASALLSMRALSPRWVTSLAEDVLHTSIVPILTTSHPKEISFRNRAATALEIGLYFIEYDMLPTAIEWLELASKLCDRSLQDYVDKTDILPVRVLYQFGRALSTTDPQNGERLLRQAEEKSAEFRYRFANTNVELHRLKATIAAGKIDKGELIIDSLSRKYGKIEPYLHMRTGHKFDRYTWATLIEVHLCVAELRLKEGQTEEADEFLESAFNLTKTSSIAPTWSPSKLRPDLKPWLIRDKRQIVVFHELSKKIFNLLKVSLG